MKTMTRKTALVTLAALALAVIAPLATQAETPGVHPAYLRALEDLRHARAQLERRKGDAEVKFDEHVAIKEIDAAIQEIKNAAIDDGKNLDNHPPVDVRADYRGRLRRASELLVKAREDVKGEEDNGFAHGLRHRAIEHINAAITFTEQGITDAHR